MYLRLTYILLLISSLLSVATVAYGSSHAAQPPVNDTVTTCVSRIYYPVNKVDIHEDYMSNPLELENIKRHLYSSPRIDSITIYSYASPEGSYEFNKWLAAERGKTARRYILDNIPQHRNFPDSLIRIMPTAENWEGLREEIVKLYTLPDKDRVLAILDCEDISDAERKEQLKRLDRGRSWQYIIRHIMPKLRYATWISVWTPVEKMMRGVIAPLTTDTVIQPLQVATPVLSSEQYYPKTILAIKSNLLYDAVTWLNYSIEVPFAGDKFSALFYHQFPWWRGGENNNEYCMRFLGLGAEARYWFAPQPKPQTTDRIVRECLVGHYVGVYGESGMWDFEHKRDICYQGEYWSVGLSYGYSMPITKHLNLEFSISGGYASIPYRGYNPSPDYSVLWRDYSRMGRWHYWGITKLQVSLVVPIVVNLKKGGSR